MATFNLIYGIMEKSGLSMLENLRGIVMLTIILLLNFGLTYFFTSSYYPVVGVAYTAMSVLGTISLHKNIVGFYVINRQLKLNDKSILEVNNGSKVLLSAAFLVIGMKIGAGITLFVYTGATIVLAFCILLASGYFFLGDESGISISSSYWISKIIIIVYDIWTSLWDRIANLIVKVEFAFLGIES